MSVCVREHALSPVTHWCVLFQPSCFIAASVFCRIRRVRACADVFVHSQSVAHSAVHPIRAKHLILSSIGARVVLCSSCPPPLACLPACSRTGRSGRSRHHRYLSLKFSRTPARETVGALSDKVRGDFCKSPWWKKVKTVTTCFSEVIIMRINGRLGGVAAQRRPSSVFGLRCAASGGSRG